MTAIRAATCCRLCLSEPGDDLKTICDENTEDRNLQQKISTSLGVEIRADDKLSTSVCTSCINRINEWHTYKLSCAENQTKLEQWLQSSITESVDASILIKEEPIEHDISTSSEPAINGDCVKIEPLEEEYNDLPPPLTPQAQIVEEDNDNVEFLDDSLSKSSKEGRKDPRRCQICDKCFSSTANRKKHEKAIHRIENRSTMMTPDNSSISQDDGTQSSVDSNIDEASLSVAKEPTTEEKKILFAAGLKLLQRNSSPPISQENLSKMELSYIEKCKAMVSMYTSLTCACHNVSHPNLKGLLSHLRALRIWFPVFTCYHCMITFTDRSSSTRHYLKCPKTGLETLVKLSNLKKRSEVKTRLYQNYKCTKCKFMYSFHEDFCLHVDEEHSSINFPFNCRCGRIFTNLEDYKDHAYISCLVQFYCDICFVTLNTLDAFVKHAVTKHDSSDGFVLLQEDSYRPRKLSPAAPSRKSERSLKREYTDEANIIPGKRERRSSIKPPIIELMVDEESKKTAKSKSITNIEKIPGTVCPICLREYSSNNNMFRHYKTHLQDNITDNDVKLSSDQTDNSLYCCPDCGGMFSSSEWEEHKTHHKKKSCNECGKIFQFQSELDQHRSVHLNLKLYRDSKTQNYKSTKMSSNDDNNVVVMCEICDRMFTSKEQLKEHKLVHSTMPVLQSALEPETIIKEQKPKKHVCLPCNKFYAASSGLWEHNKKYHPEKQKFPKKCDYCDKMFFTGASYGVHRQMHERYFKMKKAHGRIAQNDKNHESEETNDDDTESYHTCKRCFKVFSTRSNLKNHMKSHGSSPTTKTSKKANKKVWCNLCHCAFENLATLERHKIEGHGENDEMPNLSDETSEVDLKSPFIFTCDVCVQTFTTKAGLKKHKVKHAREKLIKKPAVYCKYCKIPFENAMVLGDHMKEEHMEGIKQKGNKAAKNNNKHVCKICKKSFTSFVSLCSHQGWHKRSNEAKKSQAVVVKQERPDIDAIAPPKFKCKTCSAVLPNDTALQIHILEKHRNINATILPPRCMLCNLDFTTQEEYEQHKKFHKANKPVPKSKESIKKGFPCTFCSSAFSRLDTLRNHIKHHHKDGTVVNNSEFKCSQCDRVFDKQNSLNIHLKVHEKQKMSTVAVPPAVAKVSLYNCSICNLGFDLPKDLRAHTIQVHPF